MTSQTTNTNISSLKGLTSPSLSVTKAPISTYKMFFVYINIYMSNNIELLSNQLFNRKLI
jgi:hypothetical protein